MRIIAVRRILVAVVFAWSALTPMQSQVLPAAGSKVVLTGLNTKTARVLAGSSTTTVDLMIDAIDPNDLIEVITSNPGVTISLIPPSGPEVNGSNALSFGYGWYVITGSGNSLIPVSTPGTHALIRLPANAAIGLYRVKANATGVAVDSELQATSLSNAGVLCGLSTNSFFRAGERVILTALLFDNRKPVTGATGSISITPFTDSTQGTIGNYILVSATPLDAGRSQYEYKASLTSLGPAFEKVLATVTSDSPEVLLNDDGLAFANVPAGGTVASADTFTMVRKTNVSFNPADLTWQIQSAGTTVTVPIADSGFYDARPGDGLYTASFVPTTPGVYNAVVTASGRTARGPFARKAVTRFSVLAEMARFVSFQEQAVDDNANQLTDRLLSHVTLNVQQAGEYECWMSLLGSNGKMAKAVSSARLSTGRQRMTLTYPASAILDLGISGPYRRVEAMLIKKEENGDRNPADSLAHAGATPAYQLSTMDRGDFYLTGQNSSAGLVTSGGPLYDILRVRVGMYLASTQNCVWSASISDQKGASIDSFSNSATVNAGRSSVAFDFSGMKISSSGKNGPYVVRDLGINCGETAVSSETVMSTRPYRASQFVAVVSDKERRNTADPESSRTPQAVPGPTDFSLSLLPAILPISAGASQFTRVFLNTSGQFTSTVKVSVSGLPAGVTALFFPDSESGVPGGTTLILQATIGATPGAYPVMIHGSGGGLVRTATLTLQMSAPLPGYSVSGTPIGAEFTVDGAVYHAGQRFRWLPGSTHTLSVPPVQTKLGSRHTFQNWSDGLAATHAVTAGATTNYVASFSTEHQLDIEMEPPIGGTVMPASGTYHPAGSSVSIAARPKPGYRFQSWNGSVTSSASAATTVVMAEPMRLVANFSPLPTSLSGSMTLQIGPGPARIGTLHVFNIGPGAVFHGQVTSAAFQQLTGSVCTPVVVGLRDPSCSSIWELRPGASQEMGMIFDFSGCPANAGFRVTLGITSNASSINTSFPTSVMPPGIVDATGQVTVTTSGFLLNRTTNTFNGTATITNTSQSAIAGPLQLILGNLTQGVTLANGTGTTAGKPYITVPEVSSLAPNASTTFVLQFNNPSGAIIGFDRFVLSGLI